MIVVIVGPTDHTNTQLIITLKIVANPPLKKKIVKDKAVKSNSMGELDTISENSSRVQVFLLGNPQP